MTTEEIKTRARATLARALKIDANTIPENASQLDLTAWDSVHHMNVVLALENEFEIEFDDTELSKLTSLPLMVAAIEKHTAA
jgi:acyl carrier protein